MPVVAELTDEPVGVDPLDLRVGAGCGLRRLEDLADRRRPRRVHDVEGAAGARVGQVQHERREVTRIDELDGLVRGAGRQHDPAFGCSTQPGGEPIRGVERADDVARPDHRATVPEALAHDLLACRLEGAVGLPGDLLGVGPGRLVRGRILRGARRQPFEMGRDRGDVAVPGAVGQQLGGGPDGPGHVSAGVHDGIEGPAPEGIDPFVAIPVHVLSLRIDVVRSRAAMEDRHLVPSFQRHAGQRPARELRSPDHQQLHPAPFPAHSTWTLETRYRRWARVRPSEAARAKRPVGRSRPAPRSWSPRRPGPPAVAGPRADRPARPPPPRRAHEGAVRAS